MGFIAWFKHGCQLNRMTLISIKMHELDIVLMFHFKYFLISIKHPKDMFFFKSEISVFCKKFKCQQIQ